MVKTVGERLEELKYLKPLTWLPGKNVYVNAYDGDGLDNECQEYSVKDVHLLDEYLTLPKYDMMIMLLDVLDREIKSRRLTANAFVWKETGLCTLVHLARIA